jgi:hypothetical protein
LWHGNVFRADEPLTDLMFGVDGTIEASLLAKQGYKSSTLWWNLRRLYFYIDNNAGMLVNYSARYRTGLSISSSIAESAVNQVVSHRMAKKQQMRWTDEGAHGTALRPVARYES